MFLFGSHINAINIEYTEDKIKDVKKAGGNFVQLFANPKIKPDQLLLLLEKYKVKCVVHSSYLNNLARDWDKYSFWINIIIDEIIYSHTINAIGLVIHFGKYVDLTKEEAYNNIFTSLVHIHTQTLQYNNIKIILETSSGQGTETCSNLKELSHFFNKFKKMTHLPQFKDRFKICIDTCHIFSAGYPIYNKTQIKLFIETFEELIGIKYVYLIHLNDSKVECGSLVDRHAPIGHGHIGFTGLKFFFDYFKNLNIPIILETPYDEYKKEIQMLNTSDI
jgi:deoxyribonuclease-4